MRKQTVLFLALSALLLSFCCGCADGKAETEDTAQDTGKTVTTEVYSLTLPETVTAEEGEDGALTLFRDGVEVGGVQVIPYENAEEAAANRITREEGRAMCEELLRLLSPDGNDASMFSQGGDTFCLSLYPETEEDPVETMHYFFPQGDVFYDLFLHRDGTLSDAEEQAIADSFVFAPER